MKLIKTETTIEVRPDRSSWDKFGVVMRKQTFVNYQILDKNGEWSDAKEYDMLTDDQKLEVQK